MKNQLKLNKLPHLSDLLDLSVSRVSLNPVVEHNTVLPYLYVFTRQDATTKSNDIPSKNPDYFFFQEIDGE